MAKENPPPEQLSSLDKACRVTAISGKQETLLPHEIDKIQNEQSIPMGFYTSSTSFSEPEKIMSECGLFAVYLSKPEEINATTLAIMGGTSLQHRAEGAVGLHIASGPRSDTVRELGTIAVALQEGMRIPRLEEPKIAIMHTRYPTAGGSQNIHNIQPLTLGGITLAHHGNLTNAQQIEKDLGEVEKGEDKPDSDSWVALNAIVYAKGDTLAEKVINAQKKFQGGWAFAVTDGDQVIASRDPYGLRPWFIGAVGTGEDTKGYALSVESCAFQYTGVGRNYREVRPGETIQVDDDGVKTIEYAPADKQQSCLFEFVYMMRPDSDFMHKNIFKTRFRAGQRLWQEHPVEVEDDKTLVVLAIPNSGRPGALGLFREARKTLGERVIYDERILASAYYGRNFIKPADKRLNGSKFYGIKDSFHFDNFSDAEKEYVDYLMDSNFNIISNTPKQIVPQENMVGVIVEDSIVRGDTLKKLRVIGQEVGIPELHGRITSPESAHSCYYGVATPTREELIANQIPDINRRAEYLGFKSLGYISLEGLIAATGHSQDIFCTHCFSGRKPYPHTNGAIDLKEEAVLAKAYR